MFLLWCFCFHFSKCVETSLFSPTKLDPSFVTPVQNENVVPLVQKAEKKVLLVFMVFL